jgi:hypothetical protein
MPNSSGAHSSPVQQWSQKIKPPYPSLLAWCHTTDAYTLRSLIQCQQLEPQYCPVFERNVSYFFYGRPAFRRAPYETLRQSAKAPVVAIFHPNLIKQGVRLFPFDTGAFAAKRYERWMHSKMLLGDFALRCRDISARQHVSAFFGSNKNYIEMTSTLPRISTCGEFEVEAIMRLLMDPDAESADDRRLAIELQIEHPLAFDTSCVVALIVPDELAQSTWFRKFADGPGAGIEICSYQMSLQRQSNQYQALLEHLAVEVQTRMGVL